MLIHGPRDADAGVYGLGRVAALANGADDGARAGDDVAAGVDALAAGLLALALNHQAAAGALIALAEEAQVDLLAGRHQDAVGVHDGGIVLVVMEHEPALLVAGVVRALELHAGYPAVIVERALHAPLRHNLHALFLRALYLLAGGCELVLGLAEHQRDRLRAQALRRYCDVHGDVAAADDDDVLALLLAHPLVDLDQELQAELRELLAVEAQHRAFPRAGGVEHLVVLGLEPIGGDVPAQLAAHYELNAHALDSGGDGFDVVLGQAVVGDGVPEHAARLLHFVVDGDAVAGLAQVVGGGEAGGARADDGDLDAGLALGSLVVDVLMLHGVVAERALDGVDGDVLVGAVRALDGHGSQAVAVVLAEMCADAAGDRGHGVDAVEYLGRGGPVALAQLFHIRADVRVVRAAAGAAQRGGGLHAAEDAVIARVALEREALGAALAGAVQAAAYLVGIAVEPAAHVLHDVAADGAHVADKRGRDAVRGLGQRGRVCLDGLVLAQLGERGERAYLQPAVLKLNALHAGNVLQGDDLLGIFRQYLLLELAQEVGAAGHVDGRGIQLLRGLFAGLGTYKIKSFHLALSSLKSCRAP